jgi:VWFA-related protein
MCHHSLVALFVISWRGRAAVALAAAATLTGHAAPRQQPPQPADQQRPIFRAGVSLVRVDVTVTGRDNTALLGLTAADFEVKEDGVAQTVEQVDFVRLSGEPEAGNDMSLTIRSREHAEAEAAREDVRLFAILIDDYHIERSPTSTVRVRDTLTRFIKEDIKPLDLVAVMDPLTPLSALEFTRDKEELLEPVRKFEGRRGIYFPARSVLEEAQMQVRDVARVRAQVTLGALEALVVKLGSLKEGRKSVLFVSEGPPVFFREGTLDDMMSDILRAAHWGNVAINVLDPRGLTVGGFGRGNDALYRLAGETGGRTIVNTNNWEGGLSGMLQDASAYYLLTYSPGREWADGRFHRIEVKVKRPGAKVTARRGYWAPRPEDLTEKPALDVPPDVADASASLAESGRPGRPDLWVGLDETDGRLRTRVTWEPRPSAQSDAPLPAAVSLSVLDAADAEVAKLDVPATGGQDGSRPPWQGWVDLPAGAYTIVARTRSAEGDVLDEWRRTWAVPRTSAAEPLLLTPRLFVARTPQELRRLQSSPSGAPSARREFRRTERVLVDVGVLAAEASAQVSATLLTVAGRELTRLEVARLPAGTWRFELPVGSLAVGEYAVRIEGRVGEWSASEVIAFRVRS